MPNEEYLKNRLASMAELMKEWAEESEKESRNFKDINERVSDWHRGRSQAYRLASDWIMEIIK